jgi:hypothetical protein
MMMSLTYLAAAPTTLVYSTDFEQVTKRDANRLNMGIDNWLEFGGVGGATMWLEGLDRQTPGIKCHSGIRCLGMEVTDITKSRRAQFGIYPGPLVGKGYFISVWILLPADWGLHAPKSNWYEIVNPYYNGSDAPYTAVWINQPDPAQSKFNIETGGRDPSGNVFTLDTAVDFPLPRGRWFNIQFSVLRDAVNGALKVWVDGKLVSDRRGLAVALTTLIVVVGKIYYETTDTTPHQIWVDDLEIYNGEVSTSGVPGFPLESLLVGSALGLLFAITRRRQRASTRVLPDDCLLVSS